MLSLPFRPCRLSEFTLAEPLKRDFDSMKENKGYHYRMRVVSKQFVDDGDDGCVTQSGRAVRAFVRLDLRR